MSDCGWYQMCLAPDGLTNPVWRLVQHSVNPKRFTCIYHSKGLFSSCSHIRNMLVLEKWKAKDVQWQNKQKFTDLPWWLIQSMLRDRYNFRFCKSLIDSLFCCMHRLNRLLLSSFCCEGWRNKLLAECLGLSAKDNSLNCCYTVHILPEFQ